MIALRALCAATVATIVIGPPAVAHHPGGGANVGAGGPIVTVPGTTLLQGQSTAGIMFEYSRFKALSDSVLLSGGTGPGHVHSLGTIETASLVYAYGITNNLMVSFQLPHVTRTGIREGTAALGIVEDFGGSAGLGDLTVLGQYRFFHNQRTDTHLAALVGVKAPTGETHRFTNTGERFDAEFQPGSGAWDWSFGLAATQRTGMWSFDANVLYTLASKGILDTNLGDRFHYNAAVAYRVMGANGHDHGNHHHHHNLGHSNHLNHDHDHTHGPVVDLVLELNGEWSAREETAGVTNPNSGGNVVYLGPGVRVSLDKWSAFASVGVPVLNTHNGIQSEPDFKVLTGVARAL